MRFISKYGRYGVCVRPQIQEAYATGMAKVIQEPVYAMFQVGELLAHERELAVSHWMFNGFYQDQDEVTIIPPDYRIGIFDSEQAAINNLWSDEIKLLVENTLLDLSSRFDDMLAVPELRFAPPWPRYDEYTGSASALLRKLLDEGYDLQDVLDYEQQNQARPKVIEELTRELATPSVEQEEEVVG